MHTEGVNHNLAKAKEAFARLSKKSEISGASKVIVLYSFNGSYLDFIFEECVMAKFKPYEYNQLIMLPVCLADQILPNSLEHTIHVLIEHRIDMSVFDARYNNDETGCHAYNPKLLLKIVLLGYARGLLSSRKLERACRENILFMALSCGQVPDHATIASFVSSMENEILSVFQTILLVCDEQGLLGGTCFAIDGVKLPTNASKELSGTFAELSQKKTRLETRLNQMLKTHQANDQNSENERSEAEEKARKLEAAIAKIDKFLSENKPKAGKKKENKSNITDNDSHQMKTSHGVIQGYNAQAMVDAKNQIIVHADAGDSGRDDTHLALMVNGAKANLRAIGKDHISLENTDVLADNSYFSLTNLQACINENLNAYIPDQQFRQRDRRFAEGEPKFSAADFIYDAQTDSYTCPAGQTLKRTSDIKRDGQKYYRSYAASAKACQDCSLRQQCLSKKTSKRRMLSVFYDKELAEYSHQMMQKIDTDVGRQKYHQRFGIIEPVFANIREQKRMSRFLLRGKSKVNAQWLLYCIVHNIEKILSCGTEIALPTT